MGHLPGPFLVPEFARASSPPVVFVGSPVFPGGLAWFPVARTFSGLFETSPKSMATIICGRRGGVVESKFLHRCFHPSPEPLPWLMSTIIGAVAAPAPGSYSETAFRRWLTAMCMSPPLFGAHGPCDFRGVMRRGKRILLLLFADGSGAGFPVHAFLKPLY